MKKSVKVINNIIIYFVQNTNFAVTPNGFTAHISLDTLNSSAPTWKMVTENKWLTWAEGQPNIATGECIMFSSKTQTVSTANCDTKGAFICEEHK